MLKSSIQRLEKISSKISAILEICECNVEAVLNDEISKQPAIMMHFVNIYEILKAIQETNDIKALSIFTQDEVQALLKTRNTLSHEKINFALIKTVIEDILPQIKQKIDNEIKNLSNNQER